ncbi:uncharacterized protein LOC129731540 [Wyeomyia smithii]|uniref:uncharacterized protein LOC129731540 n=1 Tax=Wyeomyia smithii TaxID=174621 RepID=UPI0024681069|nr:uncharacterized protein LOC129731540 [Wyeomyia smithii]
MSYVAKCGLCNRTLPYRKSDPSILVRHMIKYHPKFTVRESTKRPFHSQSSSVQSSIEDYECSRPTTTTRTSFRQRKIFRDHDLRSAFGEKADENLPDRRDFIVRRPARYKKMYYKTTVASWKPARARTTCSNCGETRIPTIRSTANRYSRSVLGAATIMSCWPFCFLPCLFTAPTKHHLHCSHCGAYLGPYDENREVLVVSEKASVYHRKPSAQGGGISRQKTCRV